MGGGCSITNATTQIDTETDDRAVPPKRLLKSAPTAQVLERAVIHFILSEDVVQSRPS